MLRKVIFSGIVISEGKSGYRTIFKNIIEHYKKNPSKKIKFIFVLQKKGFKNLDIGNLYELSKNNIKIIILPNFSNLWIRGLFEQFIIPIISIKERADLIFMPATFGLLFPIKPTITFVHTNTSFAVNSKLRGTSFIIKIIHSILIKITSVTSIKLLFNSLQTHNEYCQHLKKKFPKLILGSVIDGMKKTSNFKKKQNFLIKKYLKKKYILSVSQFYRLKNFHNLIRSFIDLKNSNEIPYNFNLILVGSIIEKKYYQNIIKQISGRTDIIILHELSDTDLRYLFKNCNSYCFFSFFEGFSMTPGEAIYFNKPVAVSSIPVHQEIYGKLPIYAKPNSITSIKLAIKKVILKKKKYNTKDLNKFKQRFSLKKFIERLEFFLN